MNSHLDDLKSEITRLFVAKSKVIKIENEMASINEHMEEIHGDNGELVRAIDKRRHLREKLSVARTDVVTHEYEINTIRAELDYA